MPKAKTKQQLTINYKKNENNKAMKTIPTINSLQLLR
jgi:hypothetical protein